MYVQVAHNSRKQRLILGKNINIEREYMALKGTIIKIFSPLNIFSSFLYIMNKSGICMPHNKRISFYCDTLRSILF